MVVRMRRQLKTWLVRVAVLAIAMVPMAGCGGSDSDGGGPAGPQTTGAGTTVAPTTTAGPTTTVAPTTTVGPTTTT
jgi:hypothetical protein